jgi:flagellar biosynthesis repressor protein FlbT
MRISLRAGEKMYLNGAVFSVDRKVGIDLLNDVTFLLEAHVLQPCDANTPLRRIYFAVQLMLMDPSTAKAMTEAVEQLFREFLENAGGQRMMEAVQTARELFRDGRQIEALKGLRALFSAEQELLTAQ